MADNTTQLLHALDDAQMILVGIGKEMEENYSGMEQDEVCRKLLEQTPEDEHILVSQYLKLYYSIEHGNERLRRAYQALAELLKGKNYFLVTLCTDDYIYESGLDHSRIVSPCGGFRAMQCTDEQQLITDPAVWKDAVKQIKSASLNPASLPVCPECGKKLAFNRIETPGYLEEGYLPQWEKYTKWLQGTLNRKLCILELGAGMEYPSVIRFPYEKVAFFNQKAHLFRVHSRLYQITEELKEKGTPVREDPADFLLRVSQAAAAAE